MSQSAIFPAPLADGSAVGRREEQRRRTEREIHLGALHLADERGLDGFTLEELAAAAGVSRRTLFNYFPSKADAVLGPVTVVPEDVLVRFTAAGPGGDLVEDLITLSRPLLDAHDLTADELALMRRVVMSEPRLMAAAQQRFEELSEQLAARLGEREGARVDTATARLLVRVLCAVYDVALLSSADPDQPAEVVADAFASQLRTLRALFA